MSRRIVFQGDSVTDADRFLPETGGLGNGYPHIAADYFAGTGEDVEVINRGVSGDRSANLVERWERDCLELSPDVLTILIGINDCWRKYDSNDETPIEKFAANYDFLLRQAKEKTHARLILMEPFVLPYPEDRKEWRVTLDPEIHVVREMAMRYQALLVPLDGIFAAEAARVGFTALSEDGVHPKRAGHELIFRSWLEAYRRL